MAFLALFCLLKIFLKQDFWFDIPLYLFSLVGTYEILNAMEKIATKDNQITKFQKIVVWILAVLFVPAYTVMQEFFGYGIYTMLILLMSAFLAIALSFVLSFENTSLDGTGKAVFACFYPTGALSVLAIVNHFPAWHYSCFAILFIFTVSPSSDSCAYLFGKYLRGKFPKKMSPVISPNKTVIGCIGGLVGGAACAVALYLVYHANNPEFTLMPYLWLDIVFCTLFGIVASLLNEVGDLIESAIKRKVGLKDSGNILPGHGGILDRIDGTLVMAAFVYLVLGIMLL